MKPISRPGASLILLVLAFILRVAFLEWKPPHFDEGINGWFIAQMWKQGYYRYDPTNFHGPLYFYVLQVAELLMGRGIFALRFVTAAISTGIIGVVLLHSRFFGRAAWWAAVVLALSPAMVFYGRYAIHESIFILSQVLFSYGFLRWKLEGGRTAVVCLATGVVGAVTTKETFIIFFGTWFISWALTWIYERIVAKNKSRASKPRERVAVASETGAREAGAREPVPKSFVWTTVALSILAILALFSGFLMNPAGVRDMFIAFIPWMKTGVVESGHDKPFFYWFELLWKYEWPLLVTLVLSPLTAFFGGRWVRHFAATGFGLVLAYSIIPYKTPWLILGFWPLALTFGALFEWALRARPMVWRWTAAALAVVSVIASLAVTMRLNFRDFVDPKERYVYVQSTMDLATLMNVLYARVEQSPENRNMDIQVLVKDPWPFPWLLGTYPGTSYNKPETMAVITGDVLLADADQRDEIESKLGGRYLRWSFQLRESYQRGFVYFEHDLFRNLVPSDVTVVGPAPALGGSQ